MTVVLAETTRTVPLVGVTIAFRVGAVHDPPKRAGLSRLTARMLRRGCQGLSSEQIEDGIDKLGAEFGTSVGLTSTTIHVECLARSAGAVAELVGRLIALPTVDDEELGRLKRQTEAEIMESRDSDGFLVGRAFRRQLFAGHPHSARVAGTIDTVRTITADDVKRWHAAHYCRANAVFAVAGQLSDHEVDDLGATFTRLLPEGEATTYPAVTPAPPDGRQLVIVDKPERTQTQMVIGTLGTHPRDPDHTALLVANTAFGGTFTSRLVQEVRAKRGWSYGASSHLTTGRVRESFSMWTAPAATDAADCLALQLGLLDHWHREGITAEELAFCQGYLRRSYAFEIDTAKKRLGQRLDRELLDLPADYHDGFLERVEGVTRQQANEAVRTRIAPDRLLISLVGTEADIGRDVRAAVDGLGEVTVVPYDLE